MPTPPGLRQLLPAIPPILMSGWTIDTPTTSLNTVRIFNSTDAVMGTVGWVPAQTGVPFAVIWAENVTDSVPEPNRVWAVYGVRIFLGVEHADTPLVNENYNDLALAWLESARQVIASNRRVGFVGTDLFPVSGDTRWEMCSGSIVTHRTVMGTPWYGVEILTKLSISILVDFQS